MPKPDVEKAAKLMGREPINPVGSCFDTSAFQMLVEKDQPSDIMLCHGIGIANMPGQEGHQMIHAWLEWTVRGRKCAYDTTWGVLTTVEKYRRDLQLSYCVEYTRSEMLQLWFEHDFPGPWDEKIKAVAKKNEEERKK